MIKIFKYKESVKDEWDRFIDLSKNGTFLFKRDFLEYHKDRFLDNSLVLVDEKEIVAVLPANQEDNGIISSHSGLTYGGFVTHPKLSINKVIEYFGELLQWLHENEFGKLRIKHLPDFFTKCSQHELEYIYFLVGANQYRLDTALVVDYDSTLIRKMPKGRKSEIKKGEKNKVTVSEVEDFKMFWEKILIPNLFSRFGVAPVHSLLEIELLKEKNLENIVQFNACVEGEIVAGATMFITNTTAHVQYLAGNEIARKTGALDYLFYWLIEHFRGKKKFFDFGIVNEQQGKKVNLGMLKWKESFGSRAYLHRFFEIETKNYMNLKVESLVK